MIATSGIHSSSCSGSVRSGRIPNPALYEPEDQRCRRGGQSHGWRVLPQLCAVKEHGRCKHRAPPAPRALSGLAEAAADSARGHKDERDRERRQNIEAAQTEETEEGGGERRKEPGKDSDKVPRMAHEERFLPAQFRVHVERWPFDPGMERPVLEGGARLQKLRSLVAAQETFRRQPPVLQCGVLCITGQ